VVVEHEEGAARTAPKAYQSATGEANVSRGQSETAMGPAALADSNVSASDPDRRCLSCDLFVDWLDRGCRMCRAFSGIKQERGISLDSAQGRSD
jgi:hypothetical protein